MTSTPSAPAPSSPARGAPVDSGSAGPAPPGGPASQHATQSAPLLPLFQRCMILVSGMTIIGSCFGGVSHITRRVNLDGILKPLGNEGA